MLNKSVLLWGLLTALLVAAVLLGVYVWQAMPDVPPEAGTAVEVATVEAAQEKAARPAPNFPVAVDGRVRFEDFPFAGLDERSSYRQFEIPLASASSRYLSATYLDEPDWVGDRNRDEALIFRLYDANAAFSSSIAIDFPARGAWSRIRLHLGDFAQDYCGDVVGVLSFRSARLFAISNIGNAELHLEASQCPLQQEAFLADKARYGKREEPDDFSAFCAVRRECLQAYYAQPENQAALLPEWFPEVAEVALR